MYLSKLVLNERDRTVQRDLSNAHALHQRIMQAFPDEQRESPRADWNVLFRQEPDSDTILVQSEIEPNWACLPQLYLRDHDTKPFNLQTSQLEAGRIVQFRLKANPSKRDRQTGKRIGMFHEPDQMAWLERQGVQHGFKIMVVDVIPVPSVFGIKAQKNFPIKIFSVLYQGILKINDPQLFMDAIRQGIGHGRSYGCGLLSIARLKT
jgi:CRISPR system Cascade subunit CasE